MTTSELVVTAIVNQAVNEYEIVNQSFETVRNDIFNTIISEQDYRLAKHIKSAGRAFILNYISETLRKKGV